MTANSKLLMSNFFQMLIFPKSALKDKGPVIFFLPALVTAIGKVKVFFQRERDYIHRILMVSCHVTRKKAKLFLGR